MPSALVCIHHEHAKLICSWFCNQGSISQSVISQSVMSTAAVARSRTAPPCLQSLAVHATPPCPRPLGEACTLPTPAVAAVLLRRPEKGKESQKDMSKDFTAGAVSRCPVVETAAEHCESGYLSGSRRGRLPRPSLWQMPKVIEF